MPMGCYQVFTTLVTLAMVLAMMVMMVTVDMCRMRWLWYQVQNVVTHLLVTTKSDFCHHYYSFSAATIPQIGVMKLGGHKNKDPDAKSIGGPSQDLIGGSSWYH